VRCPFPGIGRKEHTVSDEGNKNEGRNESETEGGDFEGHQLEDPELEIGQLEDPELEVG
jgi:hypothetical protein